MLNIGDRIRLARHRAGISQETLADSIRVNRSYLSLVENGKSSPTFDFIEKVADGLQLAIEDLILGQRITEFLTAMPDEGFVYAGLAEFLNDQDQMLLMNPSDDEVNILKRIRVHPDYHPSKRFFVEALMDLRKSRTETVPDAEE